MPILQYFCKEEVIPQNGYINIPENSSGLGISIDNDKIINKEYVYE